MKILSSFIHPHVIPNQYAILQQFLSHMVAVTPVPWCGRNTGRRLDPNAVYRFYL